MSASLKIKWVGGGLMWPLDKGVHVRQFHILKALAELGEVHAVLRAPQGAEVPPEIAALCRRVVLQPRIEPNPSRSLAQSAVRLLRDCQGWPLDDLSLRPAKLTPQVRELLAEPCDVTWVARLSAALVLRVWGGPGTILDLDDIEHRKLGRALGRHPWLRRARLALSASAWARTEWAALRRYERVLVCSPEDRDYLGAPNVRVVPNGTALPPHVEHRSGAAGRMVFVGSMDYGPNDEGVRWFIKEVLPRIRRAVPQAHLQVVGRAPSPPLRAAHEPPQVQVLGRVQDVVPWVQDAALSVVPLLAGGGTRLKILESLAIKTPVVSTTVGAEGLDLRDGREITIADGPEAFARACIRLLGDPCARRAQADAGHRRVRQLYAWPRIGQCVHGVVKELITAPRAQANQTATLCSGLARQAEQVR